MRFYLLPFTFYFFAFHSAIFFSSAAVFGGVGNLQFGVAMPVSLAGNPTNYNFDLSSIEIVPEPDGLGALVLAACAALGAVRARKWSLQP